MKPRFAFMFIASLVFASGCVMSRLVEISTARIEVETSNANGLTPKDAAQLFQDAANDLDLL